MGVSSITKHERGPLSGPKLRAARGKSLAQPHPAIAQDAREFRRPGPRHDEADLEGLACPAEVNGPRLAGSEPDAARAGLVVRERDLVSDAEIPRSGGAGVEVERHPQGFAVPPERTVQIEMEPAAFLSDQERAGEERPGLVTQFDREQEDGAGDG